MRTLKFSVLLLAGAGLIAVSGGCAPMPYYYDEVVVVYEPGPDGRPCPPPPHGRPPGGGTARPTPRGAPIERGQARTDTRTRSDDLRSEVRVRVPRPEPQSTPERVVGPANSSRTR